MSLQPSSGRLVFPQRGSGRVCDFLLLFLAKLSRVIVKLSKNIELNNRTCSGDITSLPSPTAPFRTKVPGRGRGAAAVRVGGAAFCGMRRRRCGTEGLDA